MPEIMQKNSSHLAYSLWILVIIILAGILMFTIVQYSDLQNKLSDAQNELRAYELNTKVLNFQKLFVEEVLGSTEEIDFEMRIQLETAVRDIGDEEILNEWNKFSAGNATEEEVQHCVINLLILLSDKLQTKNTNQTSN